jgi:coenzyme F420 hydrogenase subunit delta
MSDADRWPAPAWVDARRLVLGCGNLLCGDDGFGPAVAERLAAQELPAGTTVLDVGTGAREVLFDLALSDERRPALVVVVDAADRGRAPGELFWIEIGELPHEKLDDFSLHQAPTSNLLAELRERGTVVEVLACQPRSIPAEVERGLSAEVRAAVEPACEMIRRRLA